MKTIQKFFAAIIYFFLLSLAFSCSKNEVNPVATIIPTHSVVHTEAIEKVWIDSTQKSRIIEVEGDFYKILDSRPFTLSKGLSRTRQGGVNNPYQIRHTLNNADDTIALKKFLATVKQPTTDLVYVSTYFSEHGGVLISLPRLDGTWITYQPSELANRTSPYIFGYISETVWGFTDSSVLEKTKGFVRKIYKEAITKTHTIYSTKTHVDLRTVKSGQIVNMNNVVLTVVVRDIADRSGVDGGISVINFQDKFSVTKFKKGDRITIWEFKNNNWRQHVLITPSENAPCASIWTYEDRVNNKLYIFR